MDYRLATAMRGPDHRTNGANSWKSLVTAPLRWMAAKVLRKNPDHWAHGSVKSPTEVHQLFGDATLVARAKEFAESNAGYHVKSHARDAFEALTETSQRAIARELAKALTKEGLL